MRMRRCSVAHCVCRSDWNRHMSGVCIRYHEFTSRLYRPLFPFICSNRLLETVARSTGRFAGSDHQFCFYFNALSFSAMPVQRQPLRLLAPLTKKDIEAKKKARRLHFIIARETSVLILFDQGAPRSKGTRKWSCTFPKTTQGHCSESHLFCVFCLHAM